MPGGLIQLTVTGKENKVLTGQPEMTFFRYAYKQHTNFATESIAQTFSGNADFGEKISATISRNGDLLTDLTLVIDLPDVNEEAQNVCLEDVEKTAKYNWVNAIGHRIIEYVNIEIGGQQVDQHTGDWLELHSELFLKESHRQSYNEMVGKKDFYYVTGENQKIKLYIPLQFWFCKESGLALPLVALQYHDVKLNVKLRPLKDCLAFSKYDPVTQTTSNTLPALLPSVKISSIKLLNDYVYLDVCERTWYAQNSHKYLIQQVQHNMETVIDNTRTHKMFLSFNHPCKEILWHLKRHNPSHTNDWRNFGMTENTDKYLWGPKSNDPIMKSMTLFLNGHERVEERDAEYLRLVNSHRYHSQTAKNYIYSYSFALHPEDSQPSGALNLSLIDEAFINLKLNTDDVATGNNLTLNAYATNYNMLIITQGMGGLAFM